MIRNELSSPKLSTLNEDDQYDQLLGIWMEVKMLTGAPMYPDDRDPRDPDKETLLDIQLHTLQRFVMSHPKYSRLSHREVLHAFYMNAQGEFADSAPAGTGGMFRHYNKELNAEFVGDVLNAYVRKKVRLYDGRITAIWKALDPPAKQKEFVLTDEEYRQLIQEDYDQYRNGETGYFFLTSQKYCVLRRCGLIVFSSKQKWNQTYNWSLQYREDQARIKAARSKINAGRNIDQVLDMYTAIRISGMISKSEHRNVITTMRRQIYLKFFEIIASCGINQIFHEIQHRTNHADNRFEL